MKETTLQDLVVGARNSLRLLEAQLAAIKSYGADVTLYGWFHPGDEDSAKVIQAQYFRLEVSKTEKF